MLNHRPYLGGHECVTINAVSAGEVLSLILVEVIFCCSENLCTLKHKTNCQNYAFILLLTAFKVQCGCGKFESQEVWLYRKFDT